MYFDPFGDGNFTVSDTGHPQRTKASNPLMARQTPPPSQDEKVGVGVNTTARAPSITHSTRALSVLKGIRLLKEIFVGEVAPYHRHSHRNILRLGWVFPRRADHLLRHSILVAGVHFGEGL